MQLKLPQLRDIFELAITDKFQFKNGKHFCKLAEACSPLELKLDFYTHLISGNIRRYRKNILLGYFYIIDYGIIYRHASYKSSDLSKIKSYLNESKVSYKIIGKFLFFENEENTLPEKNTYYLNKNTIVVVRLPYTDIKGVFVPSKRTNRIFIIKGNKLYAENKTKEVVLNRSIKEKFINSDGILKIDFDSIPMLFLATHIHTYEDIEKLYTERIVKALTT